MPFLKSRKCVGRDHEREVGWAMLGSSVFWGNDHFLQIEQKSTNTSEKISLQKTK